MLLELTEAVKELLIEASSKLKGTARRTFMARTVSFLGIGGQSKAEKELHWNRETIRKGQYEREV